MYEETRSEIPSAPSRIGRYLVEGRLGAGGMGEVYRAHDPELGRPVAIKVLRGALLERAEARGRFRREARALARLNHPGLVRVLDWGDEDGLLFLVMDLVDGRPFDPRAGSLPGRLAFLERVARAVAAAHEAGVVHRDLKPTNLLVATDGSPRVVDFGLARLEGGDSLATATRALLGTPQYMAPEQVTGRPIGAWTDVHALGVLLYEVLTGRPPYAGRSSEECYQRLTTELPAPIGRAATADLATIALVALEKDPADRYRSAAELADDLGRARIGQPIAARRRSFVRRAWSGSPAFRRRAIGLLILAAALVLVAGGTLFIASGRRGEEGGPIAVAGGGPVEPPPRPPAADGAMLDVRRALGRAEASLYDRAVEPEEIRAAAAEARRTLEDLVAADPDRALVHHLLGRAWELEGWPRRAEQAWRRALALDPDLDAARFGLGLVLAEQALVEGIASSRSSERRRSGALVPGVPPGLRRPGQERARLAAEMLSEAGDLDGPVERAIQAAYRAYGEGDAAAAGRQIVAARSRFAGREGMEWLYVLHPFVEIVDRVEAAEAALALRPRFAVALFLRASERHAAGDAAGALADYGSALALRPGFAQGFVNRGVIEFEAGRHERALADYERALAIDPDLPSALNNRGNVRRELGDIEGSLADYDRSLALDPDNATALNNRAQSRFLSGDLDGAEADLRRSLELDRRSVQTLVNLGNLLQNTDRLEAALASYDQALAIDGRNHAAFLNRGNVHTRRNDAAAALADYAAALRLVPDLPAALCNRGRVLAALGRRQEALADFDRLVVVDPGNWKGRFERAMLLEALGRVDEVLPELERVLALRPGFYPAIANRAGYLARAGRLEEALAGYSRALELAPRLPDLWHNRAVARARAGDRAGAIEDLERALEVATDAWPRRRESAAYLARLRGE